jgi:hypothetical protein
MGDFDQSIDRISAPMAPPDVSGSDDELTGNWIVFAAELKRASP